MTLELTALGRLLAMPETGPAARIVRLYETDPAERIDIPGHEHQRSSLRVDGTCDLCRWCDDCDGPVALDDDPHWSTA